MTSRPETLPALYKAPTLVALVLSGLLASACGKPSADEHLRKGNEYADRSQLAEAILEYKGGLQVEPQRGDIHLKLADAYLANQEATLALREFVRAADLLPTDKMAQLKAGTILLMARAYEDAKARANRVIELDPKSPDGQILLGNALAGLNDFDGALAQFQDAVTLDPKGEASYANLGLIQLARKDNAAAETNFLKAVEVAPKSVLARLALANFQWATNRTTEAEATLKEALALDPQNMSTNRALGIFYLATNRAADAEPFFRSIALSAKTSEAKLALGDYYIAMKRYDDARKVLGELASQEKDFAAATTRLAAVDVAQGVRAEAAVKIRAVIAKFPRDMTARLFSARLLLLDGKRDEALGQATSIVSDEPTSPSAGEAYMLIGGIQASLDRRDDAIKAYEEVLKRDAKPLGADVALSALHLSARAYDKATSYAQQALVIQPNNPQARSLLVRIALAQGDAAGARATLTALQQDFPNSPTVLNLVGAQQVADRKLDLARASYTKAASLAPGDMEALSGLIGLDFVAKRPNDAVSRIETAMAVAKPSSDFFVLAARTYATARDPVKAEDALKKAIDADPARLEAYGLLAQLYVSEKRLDEAKFRFEQIAIRDPKSVPANTMLGMLLENQGKTAEAEAQYQKVLAVNPRAAVAANNLAWIYVASNRNLDQALQLAQSAQQQLVDEPHVNDTLGWIYYKKTMAAQAIRYLQNSAEKAPTDPTTHYHLGMAYILAGDMAKAKVSLEKALSFKYEFDGIAETRKALAQFPK